MSKQADQPNVAEFDKDDEAQIVREIRESAVRVKALIAKVVAIAEVEEPDADVGSVARDLIAALADCVPIAKDILLETEEPEKPWVN